MIKLKTYTEEEIKRSKEVLPNSLIHGDCLEIMKYIPSESIDMVLCDLPYQITACDWDKAIDLNKLFLEYERILKEGGE